MSENKDMAPCVVVGIGASAGGLAALEAFFGGVPDETGMAFVIVQHLDPSHESFLVNLLSRHTEMKVCTIEDRMPIEPNVVYVIPPGYELCLEHELLELDPMNDDRSLRMPIDTFFQCLANDLGDRAVAVVLSGTGNDGCRGLRDVKANGGVIIAQAPETAEYDSMPMNAVQTGIVDFVLPAEEIGKQLLPYAKHREKREETAGLLLHEDSDMMFCTLELLNEQAGQDFRAYKRSTLARRISRRINLKQMADANEYLSLLRSDPDECRHLLRDLLIGVTGFFRDPDLWQDLQAEVLEKLVRNVGGSRPIRVWVPGCSTGEEAYTIAILLHEVMEKLPRRSELQIFATDIDDHALDMARAGCYPASIEQVVSPKRLRKYFVKQGDLYQVRSNIREGIVFTHQDILIDPPFSQLDLLSCRNVMIYIEPEVQRRLIRIFHFALRPDGYLVLGSSETVGQQVDLFEPIEKRSHIFQRIGSLPRGELTFPVVSSRRVRSQHELNTVQQTLDRVDIAPLTQRLLVDEFCPAAVVVNRKFEILYYSGDTSAYLEQRSGTPSTDVITLAREGLTTRLRGVLRKVLSSGESVSITSVRMRHQGQYKRVNISGRPISSPDPLNGLILVTFEDDETTPVHVQEELSPEQESMVQQLEEELRNAKEDLRTTIEALEVSNEELKASNEEVMSMNEELQSSNEELETSKEELQSLNEELTMVNSQLQEKIENLQSANADLQNFIASNEVATVFLDRELCIRRFTPAAKHVFSLIDSDIGRPLSDISRHIDDPGLIADIKSVLDEQEPRTEIVSSDDAKWFKRRVIPYFTSEQRIDGTCLVFEDITEVQNTRQEVEYSHQRLDAALDAAQLGVWDWDLFTGRISWSGQPWELLGLQESEFDGSYTAFEQSVHPDDLPAVETALTEAREKHKRYDHEFRVTWPDDSVHWVKACGEYIRDGADQPLRMLGAIYDITERRESMSALAKSEQKYREILESITDAFFSLDDDLVVTYFNRAAEERLGHSAKDVVGRNLFDVFPEARGSIFEKNYTHAIQNKNAMSFESYFEPYDQWYDVQVYPQQVGISVYFRVTTENKRMEQELRHSEEYMRLLFESVQAGIVVQQRSGQIKLANAMACEILGMSQEEMCNRTSSDPVWEMILEDGTPVAGEDHPSMVALHTGKPVRNALRGLFSSALETTKWIIINSEPILLNDEKQPTEVLATFLDVTELKKVQSALSESEARFRSIFSSSPVGMLLAGQSGHIVSTNQRIVSLFRSSEAELLGTRLLDHIEEEGRDEFITAYKALVNGETDSCEIEVNWKHSDNSSFLGLANLSTIGDPSSDFSLVIVHLRDISQRTAMEEQLRQSEKMRVIGQLAGGVAHDFNNQLAGILSSADLLISRISEPRHRRYIEAIINAATRSADLTKQLLNFSRKGKFLSVPVDLHAVLPETASLLAHSINKNITIEQELNAEPHVVNGDPSQLQNAFLNIALNARDAMPDGGILTFATENVKLDRKFCRHNVPELGPGNYLCVRITDTGCGMSHDTLERAFEPFFTTKEQGAGIGMGLASVYGTVRSHKGSVHIESAPGNGTSVHVYFTPSTDSLDTPSQTAEPQKAEDSALMLVVDDEEIVRETMKDILEDLGYNAITAANGEDGVNRFREAWEKIDLVILDWMMPGLDGNATFEAMKKIDPNVRVILSSGYHMEKGNALADGVLGSLNKPYRRKTVAEVVSAALK